MRPVNIAIQFANYLFAYSPSGCTFWGKKPWSRKKKLLWQLGTLIGAPVGIALVAGIAVPAMIIGKLTDVCNDEISNVSNRCQCFTQVFLFGLVAKYIRVIV